MLDAIVIGAGPAGVAAARTLSEAGRSVEILEARSRVGGRVFTTEVAGRPVDLGAHWLHMAEHNPLSAIARRAGVKVSLAPTDYPVYDRGEPVTGVRLVAMRQAWSRADEAIARIAHDGGDRSIADYLPDLGEWTATLASNLSLYCGAPIEETSAQDYDRNVDGSNEFVVGGYGALIATLARPLSVRLNCPATAIRSDTDHVVVETAAGSIEARAAIVTAPVALLAAEAIRFEPRLPSAIIAAITSFRAGLYEHALLRWPISPFHANGPDRLTFLRGDRGQAGAMLTCIEGSDLHYFELGAPHRAFWGDGSDSDKRAFVRDRLAAQFGATADAAEILHVTDWLNDPWSRSAWSVCPPGAAPARDTLRDFGERRLRFAGEATSPTQPSTVGGAWLEGARAGMKVVKGEW